MSGVQNGTLAAKGDWKEDEVLLPDWDGVDLDEAIKMVRPLNGHTCLQLSFSLSAPQMSAVLVTGVYWRRATRMMSTCMMTSGATVS